MADSSYKSAMEGVSTLWMPQKKFSKMSFLLKKNFKMEIFEVKCTMCKQTKVVKYGLDAKGKQRFES
jgi:transposase-like protein